MENDMVRACSTHGAKRNAEQDFGVKARMEENTRKV
jgi:hypothetical protein